MGLSIELIYQANPSLCLRIVNYHKSALSCVSKENCICSFKLQVHPPESGSAQSEEGLYSLVAVAFSCLQLVIRFNVYCHSFQLFILCLVNVTYDWRQQEKSLTNSMLLGLLHHSYYHFLLHNNGAPSSQLEEDEIEILGCYHPSSSFVKQHLYCFVCLWVKGLILHSCEAGCNEDPISLLKGFSQQLNKGRSVFGMYLPDVDSCGERHLSFRLRTKIISWRRDIKYLQRGSLSPMLAYEGTSKLRLAMSISNTTGLESCPARSVIP